jgi:O-antigen/teichoic acid export membrane protein
MKTIRQLMARLKPLSAYRRHALVSSLTGVAIYGSGLFTGPIIARTLGPSGRGDIAAVLAPGAVIPMLLAIGLPTAAAYFVDTIDERELLATTMAFGFVVGTPISIILWFLAPGYFENNSPVVLDWARVLIALMPMSVGMAAALEIRRRTAPGASWNLWRSIPFATNLVGIVLLAVSGQLTLGSALTVNSIGGLFTLGLLASPFLKSRSWPRPSLATLRMMFPYAWRTATTGTAVSLTSRLDQVVLVTAVPPADLGRYAVAVTIVSVTNPLTSGFSVALFGHLRGESLPDRALQRYRRSVWLTLVVSAVVSLGLAVTARPLLQFAFGAEFASASSAVQLLLPGAVAFNVMGVMTTKLLSDGRPGEASLAALLGAVVTVLGLVVLIPPFGINGAAAVTSIAFVTQVVYLVARGALGKALPPSRPGPAAMLGGTSAQNRPDVRHSS